MSDIPSIEKLREYEKLGLIRSQVHPELPLNIFVYTQFTSFERLWNNVTMACRGLVVDDKGRCVVRCLPKFFNDDEPHLRAPEAITMMPNYYDKMDGSLIQVVFDQEYGVVVTSKGSFDSDQARWAKQIIAEEGYVFEQGLSYIFELIHPENRIVLDYGDRRDLTLLAVVETDTGNERDIYANRFDGFKRVQEITDVTRHMAGLVEGVVRKHGTYRVKIKTEEYVRLHRIVTEFTEKRVWEALKDGQSLEFQNMPEEFQKWLDDTIGNLLIQYNDIDGKAGAENLKTKDWTDKEVGLSEDLQYKGLVFMLRKGKPVDQAIWKMIKPKKETIDESDIA